MEQRGSSYGSKGNSLFGEVEDKRVDAQRKLISLQVKLDSLEKTHSTTKQRYARLKVCWWCVLYCTVNITSVMYYIHAYVCLSVMYYIHAYVCLSVMYYMHAYVCLSVMYYIHAYVCLSVMYYIHAYVCLSGGVD